MNGPGTGSLKCGKPSPTSGSGHIKSRSLAADSRRGRELGQVQPGTKICFWKEAVEEEEVVEDGREAARMSKIISDQEELRAKCTCMVLDGSGVGGKWR